MKTRLQIIFDQNNLGTYIFIPEWCFEHIREDMHPFVQHVRLYNHVIVGVHVTGKGIPVAVITFYKLYQVARLYVVFRP